MSNPLHSALGGALICAGAGVPCLGAGRVAGISGIVDGVLHAEPGPDSWRLRGDVARADDLPPRPGGASDLRATSFVLASRESPGSRCPPNPI